MLKFPLVCKSSEFMTHKLDTVNESKGFKDSISSAKTWNFFSSSPTLAR